jgi:hypothetical protein
MVGTLLVPCAANGHVPLLAERLNYTYPEG